MERETKLKVFRIILGSILVVALIVITIVQFSKYLNEETNMSIQYENSNWIELPSITICNDDNFFNHNQTNMTFEEYVKSIDETQLYMIETANLSYVNPAFEKYV